MKLSYYTDSLAHLSLEEVLQRITQQGVYHIELATGGWSPAPHLNLTELLTSETAVLKLQNLLATYQVEIVALNCSGNPLDPRDIGKQHREITINTFKLAEILGVKNSNDEWITSRYTRRYNAELDYHYDELATRIERSTYLSMGRNRDTLLARTCSNC